MGNNIIFTSEDYESEAEAKDVFWLMQQLQLKGEVYLYKRIGNRNYGKLSSSLEGWANND